ncbi:MAG TPA: acyltransferase family protein [Chloroflexia bacterium]|nr:acyltransferase family protein [Chloroflexia bacterium]
MLTRENIAVTAPPVASSRRYDIDWLRIGVVFLLLPYHSARVFDIWEPFYVKNAQLNDPLSYIIGPLSAWFMPLLFFLAGASSWFALSFRSGEQYATERFKRLLLPLLFGVLIIVPPQAYYARLSRPPYQDNYFQFYLNYFQNINFDRSDYDGMVFTFAHLWFVLFLAVFSLLVLPLFIYLKREPQILAKLVAFLEKPAILFLVPLMFVVVSLVPDILGKPADINLAIFILGFIFVSDKRLVRLIDRYYLLALIAGLGATAVYSLIALSIGLQSDYSPIKAIFDISVIAAGWYISIGLLGLGHRYLNFTNRLQKYLNEAVYPVYILHQTVIVIVAFYVVQLSLDTGLKFLLILAASLVTTLGLFDLVVRRANITRLLFGLKPK